MSKTYKAALLEAMQEAMDNNPRSFFTGVSFSDNTLILIPGRGGPAIPGFMQWYPGRLLSIMPPVSVL